MQSHRETSFNLLLSPVLRNLTSSQCIAAVVVLILGMAFHPMDGDSVAGAGGGRGGPRPYSVQIPSFV